MRALSILLLLGLAACGDGGRPAESAAAAAGANDGVECRIAGAARFERSCVMEASDTPDGRVLTIRKPDGGFRRLLVTRDGRGVIAADGAVPARVAVTGPDGIEVEIGGDRFRLPATVRSR